MNDASIIDVDYEEIDNELHNEIEKNLERIKNLIAEREKISDGKKLIDSISQIVWEQFILQLGATAGEDFIKENSNLKLSLKKSDHYLDSESFAKGEMPKHNLSNAEKYRTRYENHKKDFKNDSQNAGIDRDRYYKSKGGVPEGMSKDHIIPLSEIIKDPEMSTYVDFPDKKKFANSSVNLQDLPKDANIDKADKTMDEWLNSEKDGKTPVERFSLDENELKERDEKARAEKERLINEKKSVAEEEGRQSRLNELKKSASYTTQAIAVALMAKLTRTIFQELIKWLAEKDHKAKDFFEHLEEAIKDFVFDFKKNILLSVDVGVTTILTQLLGQIVPMIRKAFMFLKIGGTSVANVRKYLKNPDNQTKDVSTKVMEIGKIVTISLTTAGSIGLGAALTAALSAITPLAIPLPIIGTPASLLGIFFGGLTAGVCGAIVLYQIDAALVSKLLNENMIKQIDMKNEILSLQEARYNLASNNLENSKMTSSNEINADFNEALNKMNNIKFFKSEERESINKNDFNELDDAISNLK